MRGELERWEALRTAHFRLQFRIEIFYVYARKLLDDIAVMLTFAVKPASIEIGKHSGVAKHIGALAAEKGFDGAEIVAARASALGGRVQPFRDDYVVHRSVNKLRASGGLRWDPDGLARLSFGLIYPREGERLPDVASEHPSELMEPIDACLVAVLDVIEQLAPEIKTP
jgi:hypothetical protein